MNKTTELLNTKIYPAIYERAEQIFPEFKFKKTAGGYVSTTDTKITGEKGKVGKVYIYNNNISHLIDYTRASISLWNYIQQRDKLNTNREVLQRLAELSGVKLPQGDFNTGEYEKEKKKAQIWEDVNSYLITTLQKVYEIPLSTAEYPKPRVLLKYLENRGYSKEDVRVMELGYLNSQAELKRNLKNKGYPEEEINSIKLTEAIGKTHTLTIPLREPVGDLLGITVRNIKYKEGDKTGKYLNSTGLSKTDKLFNLRPIRNKKSIVLVEGLLDCLLASARGIENVVALGGKSFNEAQLQTAIKYGAEKITLCYDNEEGTIPNILKAIDLIKNNSDLKIYVAQLPEGIKDPDELIRKNGEEAFTGVINNAESYYNYELQHIINKYANLQDEGEFTEENKDNFLEDVITSASNIKEPVDKDIFINTFLKVPAINDLGISKESLEATVEKIKFKKDKEKQERNLKSLLETAKDLQDRGNTEGALDLLQSKTREIKSESNRATFESLLLPVTEDEIINNLRERPESLSSGYNISKDEELLLPAGAITIFSAPTSHCKTTMLINLAINTAQKYTDRKFHIFSYEEDKETVTLKALNTFIDMELSHNNTRSLKSYYSDNATKYFKSDTNIEDFKNKKDQFFNELMNSRRLNIHYVNYSSDTLIEAIEFLSKRDNIGAVFIDYMQLLKKGNGKYNSRQEELKQVCLELKDVAVNTGLPIILGAQFNRTVVNHSQIHATNIGEAGDIERVANTIIGMWNNNFKALDLKGIDENFIKPNTIYAKVLKMREGKAGTEFLFNFEGNRGKIIDRENITENETDRIKKIM